jgi:VWFA-related protein
MPFLSLRIMPSRGALTAALAALAAAAIVAQQPPVPPPPAPPAVTFRTEVNYVEIDAVVTDAEQRPVTDLTPDDFEVFEDGRRQTVSTFSLVDLPIERRASAALAGAPRQVAVEPDVATNASIAEGRIYVLVLDDLHTSLSNTGRVKGFVRNFIEQNVGVNDLVAVVHTSGDVTASQDFTGNRRLMLDAIDRFTGRRLRSEALELTEGLAEELRRRDPNDTATNPANPAGDGRDPFQPYRGLDQFELTRAYQARAALAVIKRLAELMEDIHGRRKAMLLVSEGISYNVFDSFQHTSAGTIMGDATEAMAAATRANLAIYAIDPRGLATSGDEIETSGTSSAEPHFRTAAAVLDVLRLSQQSLRVLAEQTGGFAAVNENDFSGVFDRIVRENSTYYLLGYQSTNDQRDGQFREIEVRVNRPGLQVRSRQGYAAARGPAPRSEVDPLRAARESPLPLPDIPLAVSAAPFHRDDDNAAAVAVTVEMGADRFEFSESDGKLVDTVTVAFSAVDAEGTVRASHEHVLNLEMAPQTAALTRQSGLRVVSELVVPPGRYRLRIAALEEGTGRTGSVFIDVEVPDFDAPGLHMSGLAVASASAVQTPTVRPGDPLQEVLPAPPTTLREFGQDDVIAVFAEFYERFESAQPHSITLSTMVLDDDSRVVLENREERGSSTDRQRSEEYGVEIPLRSFAPGTYVVRMEGRSSAGATRAASDLLIHVR